MLGKDFKEIINNLIQDDDAVAIMDKHCGDDCLWAVRKEHIRRLPDGEGHMVIISVRTNLD